MLLIFFALLQKQTERNDNMKYCDIIKRANRVYPNIFTNSEILDWIIEIESTINDLRILKSNSFKFEQSSITKNLIMKRSIMNFQVKIIKNKQKPADHESVDQRQIWQGQAEHVSLKQKQIEKKFQNKLRCSTFFISANQRQIEQKSKFKCNKSCISFNQRAIEQKYSFGIFKSLLNSLFNNICFYYVSMKINLFSKNIDEYNKNVKMFNLLMYILERTEKRKMSNYIYYITL